LTTKQQYVVPVLWFIIGLYSILVGVKHQLINNIKFNEMEKNECKRNHN
jgi:hypothetical protein